MARARVILTRACPLLIRRATRPRAALIRLSARSSVRARPAWWRRRGVRRRRMRPAARGDFSAGGSAPLRSRLARARWDPRGRRGGDGADPARLPIAPHADPRRVPPTRRRALPRRVSRRARATRRRHPLSLRRVTHPRARRGVAASAAADTSDAALESNAGSTLSEHARGSGVVVTSQANFLRVVVERGSITPEARRERALQRPRAAESRQSRGRRRGTTRSARRGRGSLRAPVRRARAPEEDQAARPRGASPHRDG